MDETTIIGMVIFLGALAGTLIPYILKVYRDPAIKFDINYGYSLIITTLITVFGMLPESVSELTIKVIATAFLTGYGLQSLLNRLVPPTTIPEEQPTKSG